MKRSSAHRQKERGMLIPRANPNPIIIIRNERRVEVVVRSTGNVTVHEDVGSPNLGVEFTVMEIPTHSY